MGKRPKHFDGISPEGWAEHSQCSACGRMRLVRADSGMCEQCTAKTPQARQAWAEARRRVFTPARSAAPRDPFCFLCDEPLYHGECCDGTDDHHRKFHCPDRRFSCPRCGQRFYLSGDRDRHLWGKAHGLEN